jgi:excisionase family DNA binding protein
MPDEDWEEGEYRPHWDELITLHEAAELSGLTQRHLRLLLSNGELWGQKLGRDWFTTKQAVNEYLARDRRPGPKPKDGS